MHEDLRRRPLTLSYVQEQTTDRYPRRQVQSGQRAKIQAAEKTGKSKQKRLGEGVFHKLGAQFCPKLPSHHNQ